MSIGSIIGRVASALVVGLLVTVAWNPTASANDTVIVRKVVQNSRVASNYTNWGQVIASCKVVRDGTSCTITHSTSSTRTVSLDLGITRKDVSAKLGFSSSSSVGVSVSCTSGPMKKNSIFSAWPRGDRYRYKVERKTYLNRGTQVLTNTSGWLYAFNPYANGFTCG